MTHMDKMLSQAFIKRVSVRSRQEAQPRRSAKRWELRDFHYSPKQGNVFEWILETAQKVREQNDRLR